MSYFGNLGRAAALAGLGMAGLALAGYADLNDVQVKKKNGVERRDDRINREYRYLDDAKPRIYFVDLRNGGNACDYAVMDGITYSLGWLIGGKSPEAKLQRDIDRSCHNTIDKFNGKKEASK